MSTSKRTNPKNLPPARKELEARTDRIQRELVQLEGLLRTTEAALCSLELNPEGFSPEHAIGALRTAIRAVSDLAEACDAVVMHKAA